MTEKASIIFDLDGTLADTLLLVLDIANQMRVLDRELTLADVERLKNMSVKAVLGELGIPLRRVPGLLVKGRAALTKRIGEIPLCAGMDKALAALDAAGFDLYVMSSNSQQNVQRFLANHEIDKYFKDVQGGVGIFGKAKSLKQLIKSRAINSQRAFYVGDEARDIEAAKKVGLRPVAVTWGFNSERLLKSYQPFGIARSADGLVRIFKAANL